MTVSEDEDESLAQFLESEVLSENSDQYAKSEIKVEAEEESGGKKRRVEDNAPEVGSQIKVEAEEERGGKRQRVVDDALTVGVVSLELNDIKIINPRRIEGGVFSRVPPELFPQILKFLSSEDLVSCSLVCRFLSFAAADESLWRHLYTMRWGLLPPTKKVRNCPWKKLYIQRDEEDMVEFVKDCPSEFKEYYIQMQVAKRSQAPLPSQAKDDTIILDKTVADQVSIWKRSKGLTDKVFLDHDCSGDRCSYFQIGEFFVCESTGHVHVCGDTCKEIIFDPTNGVLVCTISGHCFDRLLYPGEMEPYSEQQQCGAADGVDEAEPFMGSGRFARAYMLGYNCHDEEELEAALRFC